MVNIIVFYLASADTGNESMENVTCCPRYVKDINIRKVSQLLKSFKSILCAEQPIICMADQTLKQRPQNLQLQY